MNIGIDLGTTNTVVGWMNEFGNIEFLKFDDEKIFKKSAGGRKTSAGRS